MRNEVCLAMEFFFKNRFLGVFINKTLLEIDLQ